MLFFGKLLQYIRAKCVLLSSYLVLWIFLGIVVYINSDNNNNMPTPHVPLHICMPGSRFKFCLVLKVSSILIPYCSLVNKSSKYFLNPINDDW